MTIFSQVRKLRPGNYLEFFSIDTTPFGGSIFRIVNSGSTGWGSTINFLGYTWFSLPFSTDGFEWDGSGDVPVPTITIPDFDGTLLSLCQEYDDCLGAEVLRYITTEGEYVNDQYLGPDKWYINQKEEADGLKIRFNLATPFNQRNKIIPGKLMMKSDFPGLSSARHR